MLSEDRERDTQPQTEKKTRGSASGERVVSLKSPTSEQTHVLSPNAGSGSGQRGKNRVSPFSFEKTTAQRTRSDSSASRGSYVAAGLSKSAPTRNYTHSYTHTHTTHTLSRSNLSPSVSFLVLQPVPHSKRTCSRRNNNSRTHPLRGQGAGLSHVKTSQPILRKYRRKK